MSLCTSRTYQSLTCRSAPPTTAAVLTQGRLLSMGKRIWGPVWEEWGADVGFKNREAGGSQLTGSGVQTCQ